jgi:hypothetical protein
MSVICIKSRMKRVKYTNRVLRHKRQKYRKGTDIVPVERQKRVNILKGY